MKLFSDQHSPIATRFGRAARTYQTQAALQRHSADRLLEIIATYQLNIPCGAILEVGCGTGFITQGLIEAFPQYHLEITDLSAEMLNYCRNRVSVSNLQKLLVSFYLQNGECIQPREQKYVAIVSGFVIQWFSNPERAIRNWFEQLQPGGFLFLSFPTCHSFPEWRQLCLQNQLPFTANPLPDPMFLLQSFTSDQIHHQEIIKTVDTYSSAAVFFRGLKAIGAGFNQTEQRLNLQQMKRLIQTWDNCTCRRVEVSYETMFLVIQKI